MRHEKKRLFFKPYLTDVLKKDTRFKDDQQWQFFLQHYQQFGFVKKEIPETSFDLLVIEDLLVRAKK